VLAADLQGFRSGWGEAQHRRQVIPQIRQRRLPLE